MTVQARDFGKVAVLMGGQSAEREISLLSGNAVLRALKQKSIDAHAVDAGSDVLQKLIAGNYDRVFVVLHGRGGEDGVIQGALRTLGLPFTGTDVQGCALGMDKYLCKVLWQGMGLPTPEFTLIRSEEELLQLKNLSYPLAVKPVHEGSSIGISRVDEAGQLMAAWREAAQYDSDVLLESWIEGNEYTVSILGDQLLPVIKLETENEFYDYQAKYQSDDTRYSLPCGLSAEKESLVQDLALRTFRSIGASGWGRVDFMLDEQEQPWLIEVNTVPGMTDHSLFPMAAKAVGLDFPDMAWRILEQTMDNNHA